MCPGGWGRSATAASGLGEAARQPYRGSSSASDSLRDGGGGVFLSVVMITGAGGAAGPRGSNMTAKGFIALACLRRRRTRFGTRLRAQLRLRFLFFRAGAPSSGLRLSPSGAGAPPSGAPPSAAWVDAVKSTISTTSGSYDNQYPCLHIVCSEKNQLNDTCRMHWHEMHRRMLAYSINLLFVKIIYFNTFETNSSLKRVYSCFCKCHANRYRMDSETCV